jgi:phage terminase small subunit
MKPGTQPKPTILKLITGSNRIRRTKEPTATGKVRKPSWLDGTAVDVWRQYAPELEEIGLLTSVDVEVFAAFCCLAARMRDNPDRMTATDFGHLRLLGAVFGMSPAERSRIVVQSPDKSTPLRGNAAVK